MPDPAHCPPCCDGTPPQPCLSICWLCAGAPGAGFSEVLGLNQATGRYEGTKSRATASGGTATVQRLCNGVWSPGFPVPINSPQPNPPFTQVTDNCCPCGVAYVSVTKSCSPQNICGLGCEAGIFGSPYNQLPNDWDVPLGASLTNLGWNSCPAMADTYTVSGSGCFWSFSQRIGIIKPGAFCGVEEPCGQFLNTLNPPCPGDPDHKCCNTDGHGGCVDGCYIPCTGGLGSGCGDCGISILLNFVAGTCGGNFVMNIAFGCSGSLGDNTSGKQFCQGQGSYTSDFFPAASPVPSSVTLHGGGSAGPACTGSLPGSITINAA